MKQIFTLLLLFFISFSSIAQKINGQWRGYFNSNGDIVLNGDNNTEYVLELEITGSKVSGFSYSYFQNRMYYVICKLEGNYYKASKSIKVTEVERVKGNTPEDFSDCLQTHFLSYEKEGKNEKMVGKWETAPGQKGNCGTGLTTLVRRTLSKDLASFKAATKIEAEKKPTFKKENPAKIEVAKNNLTKKTISPEKPNTPQVKKIVVAKNNSNKKTTTPSILPVPAIEKTDPALITIQKETKKTSKKIEEIPNKTNFVFEKRKTDVLQTIQIEHETFTVSLYDNGEVDGDVVSLFYNGNLILSNKMLSEKPITITLDATNGIAINELTMYADNLGEIAPNTALMVVLDGDKRYEVRISSDLKNSGTIHFIHK